MTLVTSPTSMKFPNGCHAKQSSSGHACFHGSKRSRHVPPALGRIACAHTELGKLTRQSEGKRDEHVNAGLTYYIYYIIYIYIIFNIIYISYNMHTSYDVCNLVIPYTKFKWCIFTSLRFYHVWYFQWEILQRSLQDPGSPEASCWSPS